MAFPETPRKLPTELMIVGSIVIFCHFLALVALALTAYSGPWNPNAPPTPPPPFAVAVSEVTTQYYLAPLHMTHNYHFTSNRIVVPSIYFEANLVDEQGETIKTLKFPDPRANSWVQHRQSILAQNLGGDQQVQRPQGENIQAPGEKARQANFFFPPTQTAKTLEFFKIDEHLLQDLIPPGGPPLFRPSEGSLALAKSYMEYLQNQHKAAGVEIVRHSHEPLGASLLLFVPEPPNAKAQPRRVLDVVPPQIFDELVVNFGNGEPKKWEMKK